MPVAVLIDDENILIAMPGHGMIRLNSDQAIALLHSLAEAMDEQIA